MMQSVTNSTSSERTARAEFLQLDLATARSLLGEHGYDLVERFGHVHATRDAQEWHLCLVADFTSMSPARLLALLKRSRCVLGRASFSPLRYERRART